jgi:hypothetical protein
MKGRALLLASALALGAFSACAAASCTTTQTQITLSGVCEDITKSKPTLFSPKDGACVTPLPDGTVPVIVDVNGTFAFRPPGASCAYVCNCGYLQVWVDGVLNNTSGTAVIDANFSQNGTILYGAHTVTVQLVWDLNDGGGLDQYDAGLPPDAGPDAGPLGILTASVDITLAPSCPAGSTGDAGTTDAGPADAGSSDAGTMDAGTMDAGTMDAGPADAGPADAGPADAGPADAGSDGGSDGG